MSEVFVNIEAYNRDREEGQLGSLCHASRQNLLFIQSGAMLCCHYNRGYILGTYPEQSPMEAWSSEKRGKLSEALMNYSAPGSCSACTEEIRTGHSHLAGCKKYDYLAGKDAGQPISLEFQLSNLCNLECLMCSGEYSSLIREKRESGPPYPNPWDSAFIRSLEPWIPGLRYASFTGGEPFLNPLFYEFWDRMATKGPHIRVTVSTNGTVLDDRIRKLQDRLNMEWTLSVDSLDASVYEKIRKNADYERVMKNIRWLIDAHKKKNRLLSVKFVVMKENIRTIPALFQYFHEKHVQLFPKPAWVPFEQTLRYAEADELNAMISLLKKQKLSRRSDVQRFNIMRFNNLISFLEAWLRENNQRHIGDFNGLSTEQMEQQLERMILQSIRNDDLTELLHKQGLIDFTHHLTVRIRQLRMQHPGYRSALCHLLQLPPYTVINEVYRMDDEKFIRRFFS